MGKRRWAGDRLRHRSTLTSRPNAPMLRVGSSSEYAAEWVGEDRPRAGRSGEGAASRQRAQSLSGNPEHVERDGRTLVDELAASASLVGIVRVRRGRSAQKGACDACWSEAKGRREMSSVDFAERDRDASSTRGDRYCEQPLSARSSSTGTSMATSRRAGHVLPNERPSDSEASADTKTGGTP